MSHPPNTSADACTMQQDLARQLDELLNNRDKLRELWERQHVRLVHALLATAGTEAARDYAHRAWAAAEAADLATDSALALTLAELRRCGVVVDLPPADDAHPELADSEGGEL